MFSIVIPLFNEAENIIPLLDEIKSNLSNIENYEIVLIDDASVDLTINKIKSTEDKKIKIIKNKKNEGQSYSIHKGIKNSNYNIIITLDGDGQNDPADINYLLKNYLSNEDIYLVGGLRKNRKDTKIKIVSSRIANFIRRKILNDGCNDTGCSLKVFDKNIFLSFPYFDGMHRFLPALFKGYNYKTKFIPVNHRKRKHGESKYGTMNRLFKGVRDILKVRKIIKSNQLDV
tara:strand:+ start:79 stop:768 length:690 start_codon:yes stop_codon:yes gene_type:complete